MKNKRYFTWIEPVYLITLPIPKRVEICYECGTKAWRWENKGFIKVGDIEHKRERTALDDAIEATAKLFDRVVYESLERRSKLGNYMLGKK